MGVKDRVALITGSGQGIGEGIARSLAAAGAKVVLNDVDAQRVASLCDDIKASGHEAGYYVGDISTKEGATGLVEYAMDSFSGVDILVNNAGIARDKWLVKMSEEDWDEVIRVNLKSQFLCTQAAVGPMMQASYGRIVNIGSRAWLGGAGQANYSASKGAVVSFTRTLALEFAKYQITANAIAPGLVDSPLFRSLSPENQEKLTRTVPVGRIGSPSDIGHAVRFFADDDSWYITGQVLYVCGGRSVGAY
ncbi:MAG: 3-oxoacyl-ACP reductase FabG [Actinomycetota bacterium]|jgi:NAD(P)-dependent dehydrogenase (short-subunit alcohol dehydrogenase family)|nr:3-oxoacyl-ACP reductase FabG [Actinomycetota bacterium]